MTLSESLKILAFMLVLLVCLQCHVADQVQQDVFSLMKMQLDDRYGHCVLSDWNPNQVNPCTWSHVNCQDNGEVTAITLSSCGLTGILSPRIANLTTLQQLSLDSNSIAGRIPQEFGDLSNLVTLQLGRNNLNGSLPASLGSLLKLQTMDLSQNQLSGRIPSSLQNLQLLSDISLEGNYISGEIPPELGNLSSLVSLNLGRNDLSGSIPDSFGHLKKIQKLDLSGNRLTGNIPSTLTGLQSLNYINLAYNNLSGEIPVQLLQVAQYDFTGNSLNCGQPSIPCAKRATSAGGKGKGWVIPTIVSLLAVFICFILFFGWIRRQRQGKQSIGYKLKVNVRQELEIEGSSSNITIFDFSHVLEATNGFSVENKLGQGGFGPVYKGQFPNGSDIAVKRLASHSGQGFREFKNEVQLIAKLQHRNLVRLMGCCSQGEEKMLIYEYLPNKSLDFFIFDETRCSLLNWSKRMTIIEGIAQGLLYLHKHSRLRVIHRDVKASNILLDSEMNPKISDFGLAKMFDSNDTEGNTKRVVGTYGYMAPEYASEGLYSIKSDVFSFGVLILEIITGKRNSGFHQYEDFLNLLGYAWQLWSDGRWLQLVDASLVFECHQPQALEMMRCINIALLCVQENAVDRPTMTDVVAMLSSTSMVLSEPNHPAYFHVRVAREEEASASAEQCSANDVTISSPRGR